MKVNEDIVPYKDFYRESTVANPKYRDYFQLEYAYSEKYTRCEVDDKILRLKTIIEFQQFYVKQGGRLIHISSIFGAETARIACNVSSCYSDVYKFPK